MLTGEKPEVNAEVAARLASYGHDDFTSYVAWACERALERGMLPHTNIGAISKDDLARLREVTASQGLMLESVNPDLVVHQGSPTKHPAVRLDTIRAAGELKIPFTSGILVGIGESPEERIDALTALAEVHDEYGHLQEVILQNFVPAPALLRSGTRGDRGRGAEPGNGQRRTVNASPMPAWAQPNHARRHARAGPCGAPPDARRRHPDPAQPLRLVAAARRGGRDRPRRAVRERRPHLARAPVPVAAQDAQAAPAERLRADRAAVRVPAVHGLGMARAGRARRDQAEVLELHPAARIGPPRRTASIRRDLVGPAIEKARDGALARRGGAHRDVRRDAARGHRGHAPGGGRACAASSRATRSRSSSTATSTCRTSASSAARSAASGRASVRRTPTSTARRSSSAACDEAVEFGATEICMQSGIHPDWTIEDYEKWLRLAKEVAPEIHLHAYSPMEVDAPRGRHAARRGVRAAQGRRARLDTRHRRRGARRRRARADLAEQAAREALGRGDRGVGARRALDQRDGDVRAHRGAVGAGRAHARDPRAAGADRTRSTSSCRSRSSRSTRCSAARTGSRRSRARRT